MESSGAVAAGNPFVGPYSLKEGEPFYGRNRATTALLNQLIADRIVLLYSPSGAGKTSLVEAGLKARLREYDLGFRILPTIRVGLPLPRTNGSPPSRFLRSALLSLGLDAESQPEQVGAAELAHFLEQTRGSEDPTHKLLVFDQFEEALTTSEQSDEAARRSFFVEIGEFLRQDSRCWALFCLREDHLAALDPFLRPIPTSFRNRFRLDLMTRGEARIALQELARSGGVELRGSIASRLVKDLAAGSGKVEPLHLQVVGYQMWSSWLAGAGGEAGSSGGLDVGAILGSYYAEQMQSIAGEDKGLERRIREWFQQDLITGRGTRNLVEWGAGKSEGLDESLRKRLEDAYLVRAVPLPSQTWYELAHDRFIDPVLRDNSRWREALHPLQRQAAKWTASGHRREDLYRDRELAEARAWAAAHDDELEVSDREFLKASSDAQAEADRQRRRWLWFLSICGIAGVSFILALFLFVQWSRQVKRSRFLNLISGSAGHANRVDQALLLSVEAHKAAELVPGERQKAEYNLLASLCYSPQLDRFLLGPELDPQLARIGKEDVFSVAWNKSQPVAAIGKPDGTILLFGGGHSIPFSSGYTNGVASLSLSPDGTKLAAADGSEDSRLSLWDLADQAQPRRLGDALPVTGEVRSVAFSSDSKRLTAGANWLGRAHIYLWDVTDRPHIITETSVAGEISRVSLNKDGCLLAVGTDTIPGHVYVWNEDRRSLPRWDEKQQDPDTSSSLTHAGPISGLAFTADDRVLASSDEGELEKPGSCKVLLWNFPPGSPGVPRLLQDQLQPVYGLAFSANGRWLAGGGKDRTVHLWQVGSRRSGESLSQVGTHEEWKPPLLGHTGTVRALAFDSDGGDPALLSFGQDGHLLRWSVGRHHPLILAQSEQGHPLKGIAFSPNGATLASIAEGGAVILRDPETAGKAIVLQASDKQNGQCLAFHPNNRMLAVGHDLPSAGQKRTSVSLWHLGPRPRASEISTSSSSSILGVAFRPPTGEQLAIAAPGLLELRDTGTGSRPVQFQIPPDTPVTCVAFSPTGRYMAAGDVNGELRLWDLDSFPGKLLVLGTPVFRHQQMVTGVAFAANGRLASAGLEGNVLVWDPATGRPLRMFSAPPGAGCNGVAFSADGTLVATGADSGAVLLWNVDTGEPLGPPLIGHDESVNCVAFRPGRAVLASSGNDGRLVLWDLDVQHWLSRAGQIAHRQLTDGERHEIHSK
jgi:WD40 repeat protein